MLYNSLLEYLVNSKNLLLTNDINILSSIRTIDALLLSAELLETLGRFDLVTEVYDLVADPYEISNLTNAGVPPSGLQDELQRQVERCAYKVPGR